MIFSVTLALGMDTGLEHRTLGRWCSHPFISELLPEHLSVPAPKRGDGRDGVVVVMEPLERSEF